jgi:translocation and assembly module TamA
MQSRRTGPGIGIAFRRAGTVIAVAAGVALGPVHVGDAFAFKLFGINFFGSDEETADPVPDPIRYTIDFRTGDADKDLKAALDQSSMLVADKDKPVSGDLGVVIKARDDRDRLLATLYEQARYGGVVTVTVNGTDIDKLPPNPTFDRSKPVPVAVSIAPGPLFKLGKIRLEGDAANRDPKTYGLVPGGEAGSLVIIKAGDKIVANLKDEGRPLAKVLKRDVVADHDTNTVDVTLTVESGPIAKVGRVTVTGEKRLDPEFVQRYSRINPGDKYSPTDLKKATERLRKLGAMGSVTIHEPTKLDPDGTFPLNLEISEAKRHYFGAGAQYSTTDGIGLNGYWGDRNLFGQAESLRIEGTVSRLGETQNVQDLDYTGGIIFTKPGAFFPAATFTASVKAASVHPDNYDADTITGDAGLAYELTDYDTVSAGGRVSYEKSTTDAFGDQKFLTFSVPLEYVRDTRDNKLDPTVGYKATLDAEPSYEAMGGTVFTSLEGSISGYKSIGADDNVVFAGKLAAGSLLGANDISDIPTTRRFFAGGGGSVRGYAYQEITPYNALNQALGGRSYATASLEARIKITKTIGLVPFVDAGSVTDSTFPDFSDPHIGAGIGLRYATPFGPIRVDFAVPLNKYQGGTAYGIYAGIGQSF